MPSEERLEGGEEVSHVGIQERIFQGLFPETAKRSARLMLCGSGRVLGGMFRVSKKADLVELWQIC